jgi:hypothetical protein
MRWSRRRHMRQRRQLRRAVAFLHETHNRVPFDPVDYLAVLPIKQLARLVMSGQVAIRRLSVTLRQNLRAWGERNKVTIP